MGAAERIRPGEHDGHQWWLCRTGDRCRAVWLVCRCPGLARRICRTRRYRLPVAAGIAVLVPPSSRGLGTGRTDRPGGPGTDRVSHAADQHQHVGVVPDAGSRRLLALSVPDLAAELSAGDASSDDPEDGVA